MAFDERGQAETAERKVEILGRAYDLLVGEGFAPDDIVLDPNVLAVATGIEEHAAFAKAFIDAVAAAEGALPGRARLGRDLEPLFAFRGNDAVREAMHASFLYHAIRAGLDMGIVNAGQLAVYEDIAARPAGAGRGRDLRPTAGRDRAAGRARATRRGRRRRSARSTSPGATRRSRSGSRMRSSTGSSTSSRRTPRRRAQPPSGRST